MPHYEQDPPSVSVEDAVLQTVITWVAAKTETSLATAESELLAIMDTFHIVRLEDSGPAKIAELFDKYRED
jgi:hypothetical protein